MAGVKAGQGLQFGTARATPPTRPRGDILDATITCAAGAYLLSRGLELSIEGDQLLGEFEVALALPGGRVLYIRAAFLY